ncbi:MAG: hypothetical protein MZW92_40145 [Comamonadaceae bacterium]|nr:hypothetical protein [Comamonadaceae bacterium]
MDLERQRPQPDADQLERRVADDDRGGGGGSAQPAHRQLGDGAAARPGFRRRVTMVGPNPEGFTVFRDVSIWAQGPNDAYGIAMSSGSIWLLHSDVTGGQGNGNTTGEAVGINATGNSLPARPGFPRGGADDRPDSLGGGAPRHGDGEHQQHGDQRADLRHADLRLGVHLRARAADLLRSMRREGDGCRRPRATGFAHGRPPASPQVSRSVPFVGGVTQSRSPRLAAANVEAANVNPVDTRTIVPFARSRHLAYDARGSIHQRESEGSDGGVHRESCCARERDGGVRVVDRVVAGRGERDGAFAGAQPVAGGGPQPRGHRRGHRVALGRGDESGEDRCAERGAVARGARQAACGPAVFGEPRRQLHGTAQRLRRGGGASDGRAGAKPQQKVAGSGPELVYTPITPCRILDSRFGVGGSFAPGATQAFKATNPGGTFSSQGGSASNCSIPVKAQRGDAQLHRVQHRGGACVHRGVAVRPAESGHGDAQLDVGRRAGGERCDACRCARAAAARRTSTCSRAAAPTWWRTWSATSPSRRAATC